MQKKIFLIMAVFLLTPGYIFAQSQIEFTPSISLSDLYDDNIDLDRSDEKSDWITSISPGLDLNIISQKTNFSLQYSPSIVQYKEEDYNDTIRHSASFAFDEQLTEHLILEMNDTYLKSEEPIEETEGIIGIRETRNTYQRNNWGSSINYTFGPTNSFILGYTYSWLENEDITLDDGEILDSYMNLISWINVKHGVESNIGYTVADFSRDDNSIPDDDYSGITSGLGYLYRIKPHMTFSFNYDFTNREFKGVTEDYMVHESSIGLEQQFSETLSYNISAGYFIQDNNYSDEESGYLFDVSLQKEMRRGRFSFGAKGGWDEIYLEAERRGFTKYQQLDYRVEYNVTENLRNYSSILYRQDKDSTNRESKTIRVNYGWRWFITRFYSVSLDYYCTRRDDDLPTGDYNVNRVTLRIELSKPYRW